MALPEGLTPKQTAFVREYLLDFNATQAALRAGYTETSAKKHAWELLQLPLIQEEIRRFQQELQKAAQITVTRVVKELAVIAYSDVRNYEVDEEGEVRLAPGVHDDAMRAVSKIKRKVTTRYNEDGEKITTAEVEIAQWSKPHALHLLGQYLGAWSGDGAGEQEDRSIEIKHRDVTPTGDTEEGKPRALIVLPE